MALTGHRRELYSFLEKMTSWLKSRKAAGGAHKPHATHVAIRILSDRSLFIALGGGREAGEGSRRFWAKHGEI